LDSVARIYKHCQIKLGYLAKKFLVILYIEKVHYKKTSSRSLNKYISQISRAEKIFSFLWNWKNSKKKKYLEMNRLFINLSESRRVLFIVYYKLSFFFLNVLAKKNFSEHPFCLLVLYWDIMFLTEGEIYRKIYANLSEEWKIFFTLKSK